MSGSPTQSPSQVADPTALSRLDISALRSGDMAWVDSSAGLWVLDRASTATLSATVVATKAGVGRWILLSSLGGAAVTAQVVWNAEQLWTGLHPGAFTLAPEVGATTFTSSGRTLLFLFSGTAFAAALSAPIDLRLVVDGIDAVKASVSFVGAVGSTDHTSMTGFGVLSGLPAGVHNLQITLATNSLTSVTTIDRYSLTVVEIG